MHSMIFVGFMGAGKTTIGRLMSEHLGKPFIDFDEYLVQDLQMSIPDFFNQYGEEAFRKKESLLLERLKNEEGIISTGGGIVLKETNRDLLTRYQPVIYLQAKAEICMQRLKEDVLHIRPLIVEKKPQEILDLFLSRVPLYEEVADYVVDTSYKTPEQIVEEILVRMGE